MKKISKMYSSEEKDVIIKLSSRCDKRGNIFFCVNFGMEYYTFAQMSSALDFIQSNFKED